MLYTNTLWIVIKNNLYIEWRKYVSNKRNTLYASQSLRYWLHASAKHAAGTAMWLPGTGNRPMLNNKRLSWFFTLLLDMRSYISTFKMAGNCFPKTYCPFPWISCQRADKYNRTSNAHYSWLYLLPAESGAFNPEYDTDFNGKLCQYRNQSRC